MIAQQNTQDTAAQNTAERQIQIKATDEKLAGQYANMMQAMHTKEEFVLDFISFFPPAGTLNSRVILSPAHCKRILKALEDNLKKYETAFGTIDIADVPESRIGFTV